MVSTFQNRLSKNLIPIVLGLLLVGCGGGSSSPSSDEGSDPLSDTTGGINNDGTNGSNTVESTNLQRLAGPVSEKRVWMCERTEQDGGVFDTVLEFGELSKFNSAWVRFINPSFGGVISLYNLVEWEDRINLDVPGIDRVAPFLQSESDSRTRRFVNLQFNGADSFTADYQEFSVFNSYPASLDCRRSTQSIVIASEVTGWPESRSWPDTPNIYAVEGLRDNSSRRFLLSDACNDGSRITLTFHETFNSVETGAYWPAGNRHYIVTSQQESASLTCAYGTYICYSAKREDGQSGYWGLNPDLPVGERSCDSCCSSCPAPVLSSNDIAVTLTCG